MVDAHNEVSAIFKNQVILWIFGLRNLPIKSENNEFYRLKKKLLVEKLQIYL